MHYDFGKGFCTKNQRNCNWKDTVKLECKKYTFCTDYKAAPHPSEFDLAIVALPYQATEKNSGVEITVP